MTINNVSGLFGPGPLFGRRYSIAIGAPNQTAALQYGTESNPPSPIRIKFDVDKPSSSFSKAKIELYNLSTQSRQAIKKGYIVLIRAGYKGIVDQVFVGNVSPYGIGAKRNGPDIVTTLECGGGESAVVMSKLDKSYGAGTTILQILQDCATALHTENAINPEGINAGLAIGIPTVVFNKGFTARGPVSDTLDKILKPQGLEWSVQNGNLNIVPKTSYNGQQAIVVSSDTGMIGVPSLNEGFVKFSHLLNPKLIPGALINLKSENTALNGFYRIRRSHFDADSHDNKWGLDCECISMPNVQPLANTNLLSLGGIA